MNKFLAALVIVLFAWPVAAATDCSLYGGRATVVQANGLGILPLVLSDTGNLDSTGGAKEASLNTTAVGPVTGEALHATAIARGNYSRTEASIANLNVTVAGNTIHADFVMARANGVCGDTGAAVSGVSEITGLTANGLSVPVTGLPNQTVPLLGGALMVLNEQVSSVQGQTGSISVNAMHVTVPGVTNLVVVTPYLVIGGGGGGGGIPECDFVTGGGFITTPSGARGNFGVAGGLRNSELWGHLEYIDHGTGMKVKGTGVLAYYGIDSNTRHIDGTASIDGQSGFTYAVDVTDNGEPGRDDMFTITLSNGYTAGGSLSGGGNIQLHNTCQE